jgi:hypothetical protein
MIVRKGDIIRRRSLSQFLPPQREAISLTTAEAIARVGTGIAGSGQPGYDGPIMSDLPIPTPECAARPGLPFPSVCQIRVSWRINGLSGLSRFFSVYLTGGRPAVGDVSFANDHI